MMKLRTTLAVFGQHREGTMRTAAISCFVLAMTATCAFALPWTPAELYTPATAWYDASDTNTLWADTAGTIPATTNVARWDDKSTNAYNLTQGTTNNQPTTGVRTIGGLNALKFVHAAKDIMYSSLTQLTTVSIYIVIDPDSIAGYTVNGIMSSRTVDTGNGLYWVVEGYNSNIPDNSVSYSSAAGQLSSSNVFMNGVSLDVGGSDHGFNPCILSHRGSGLPTASLAYAVGNDRRDNNVTHAAEGGFGEILICPEVHDTATRQTIEGYLAWKWGIQNKLPADHPYKTSAPRSRFGLGTVIRIR
jgi:hypothetical protein